MRVLLPLPVLLPLIGAALSILAGRSRAGAADRQPRRARPPSPASRWRSSSPSTTTGSSSRRPATGTRRSGSRSSPTGSRRSCSLTASCALLAVVVYAIGQPGAERNHVGFQSVYLILAAGVAAAFLTGDLFNLFVAIEMMLTASYVLITLGGRLDQVRSGMTYVVISLAASVLFLAALAFTYAATGTVNMADLAGPHRRRCRAACGRRWRVCFLVVFGIKAGLFPLFFWLPDSYPTAPSPVTAIFAGLLTKVGVYAIIRTQTLLFPEVLPTWLLMVIAGATMLVGVLGAIAQDDVKRILSFLIISSIGYMVMGMALFTVAGIAAAIVYMVHQVVLKTALFLAGGMIEHAGGSSRLSRLGDMARTAPMIAVIFFVPAMSLAGIPPMSGFAAKFALLDSVAAVVGVVDPRRGGHRRAADLVLDRQDLDRRVLGAGRSVGRAGQPTEVAPRRRC